MGSSASKKKTPKPRGFDPPPAPPREYPREYRLKGWPALTSELYVDPEVGSARNDGSKEKPFDTIMNALKVAGDNTAIYLAAGVYRNHRFGSGDVGNPAVATVQNVNNILLTAVDGARPRIEFDGAGGISARNVTYLEVCGVEIVGPGESITKAEAMADRTNHSPMYSGRGICVWSGSRIHIHHNTVSFCPNSGIRINKGDHCCIESNEVHSCCWWSSNAESAVVIAEAHAVDASDDVKMVIRANRVHGNMNKIPYYNAHYDDPQYMADHQMHVARKNYGSSQQTFIIDGSGVYITRNSSTYSHGQFLLADNVAFENGINGLVVHKTDRVLVKNNVLFENGKVSKKKPQSRQPYAGLVVTHSQSVTLSNNRVRAPSGDFAYTLTGGSTLADGAAAGAATNHVVRGEVSPALAACVSKMRWRDFGEWGGC